jgi:hypothetical protein
MTEEQTSGLLGLGQKLVTALPSQFLALLLVNILVVGGVLWHLDNTSEARERLLAQIITSCMKEHQ